MLSLPDAITSLPGVGPTRGEQLNELGITTIQDLLYAIPFRYETIEQAVLIKDLADGTTVNFKAKVVSKLPIASRKFRSMIKARVADETGIAELVWFNTPFVLSSLKVGEEYYFTGKVTLFKGKASLTNPTFEVGQPQTGSQVPVYHESAVINSRFLRKLITHALAVTDIPEDPQIGPLAASHDLPRLKQALTELHHPGENPPYRKLAKERLAYDEMITTIRDVLHRKAIHEQSSPRKNIAITNKSIDAFLALLPYAPTPSQSEAIHAIALDLVQKHPMHRLVQGEVGSGKTTVAAFALYAASLQAPPAFLICPTNILAQQHFETLQKLFAPMKEIKIGMYTGNQKDTDCNILVGTHALFGIKGLKPSLIVIDEEHRFGVKQRESFFSGAKKPHLLSMTATPIPRTVALSALADYDVSFIVPHKSNDNIKTFVTPLEKRDDAYAWIEKIIEETGGQAMIVCPFIEVSQIDTFASVKSAKQEFTTLKKIFPKRKLKLLHGSLKQDEKDAVFASMMKGTTDILVTTPVVEVGVDIPKANIMVIEGAERYGLAALHQLRGRVGRRGQDAYCLLFTTSDTDATTRLHFFAKTYDGNALATYDLHHRGSGELLGAMQHGFDSLRFATWSDERLIAMCKQDAVQLLDNPKKTEE